MTENISLSTVNEQRRFVSDYHLRLMKKAVQGSSPNEVSGRNFYSSRRTGEEYEGWKALARVGIATSQPFNDDLVAFKLTEIGLAIVNHAISEENKEWSEINNLF